MKVMDDLLPEWQFKAVQSLIMGTGFPWYYGMKTDAASADERVCGWFHSVYNGSHTVYPSSPSAPIWRAALDILKAAGETPKSIMRVRLLANTRIPETLWRGVHVDFEFPHQSAVFYVNDADGDTVIFKDRCVEGEETPINLEIMEVVEPKANRAVFFDGLHYHTGTLPTMTTRRVVMNINYIKGEQ